MAVNFQMNKKKKVVRRTFFRGSSLQRIHSNKISVNCIWMILWCADFCWMIWFFFHSTSVCVVIKIFHVWIESWWLVLFCSDDCCFCFSWLLCEQFGNSWRLFLSLSRSSHHLSLCYFGIDRLTTRSRFYFILHSLLKLSRGTRVSWELWLQGNCDYRGTGVPKELWLQGNCDYREIVITMELWLQGICDYITGKLWLHYRGNDYITGELWLLGDCEYRGIVITGELWLQGNCDYRGTVITAELWLQRNCDNRGTVITGELWLQRNCDYKGFSDDDWIQHPSGYLSTNPNNCLKNPPLIPVTKISARHLYLCFVWTFL